MTGGRSRGGGETITRRVSETIKACQRGWAVTPLRGKVPILAGWQDAPPPTHSQAIAWAHAGNIGLRTGRVSRLVVIDLDIAKGGDADRLGLPPTVTVLTGGGGRHFYFRHPGGKVPNSVGRLGPHVDVRGDGGQAVFVGSVHPHTGRPYAWAAGRSPEDVSAAALPRDILRQLTGGLRGNSANCANSANYLSGVGMSSAYGRAALDGEVLGVQTAPYGTRNDRLNRAAYRLGQLIADGHLFELEVVLRLLWAAEACGLPVGEASRTIRSGLMATLRELQR